MSYTIQLPDTTHVDSSFWDPNSATPASNDLYVSDGTATTWAYVHPNELLHREIEELRNRVKELENFIVEHILLNSKS